MIDLCYNVVTLAMKCVGVLLLWFNSSCGMGPPMVTTSRMTQLCKLFLYYLVLLLLLSSSATSVIRTAADHEDQGENLIIKVKFSIL